MTVTHPSAVNPVSFAPPAVLFDLYRDVHKGIHAELFAVTATAGSVDPGDQCAVVALVDHIDSVVDLLALHAHHEDTSIDPALQTHLPDHASVILADHETLDHRITTIADRARSATEAPKDRRRLVQLTYLDLASFASAYLAHQDMEERIVMPALELAIGIEAVVGIHEQIVQTMPPEDMITSLAVMLPAMNLDDRVEMLSGMRAGAPPEAFQGVLGLAASVLDRHDFDQLTRRLDG